MFDLIDASNEELDLIEKRQDRAWVLRPIAERLGASAKRRPPSQHRTGSEFTGYA